MSNKTGMGFLNTHTMKSLITCLAIIFCISSCRNKEQNYTHGLIPQTEKRFNLDDSSSIESSYIQLFSDMKGKKECVTFINKDLNAIDFFEASTGNLYKRITFEKEGPNGVGNIDGYYIHTLDSIFVVRKGTYLIYLTNENKVVKTYSLLSEKISTHTSLPWVGYGSNLTKVGNQLIMVGAPDDTHSKESRELATNMITLNIKSSEVRRYCHFPKLYQESEKWSSYYTNANFTHNLQSGKFYISFAADENVIETDFLEEKSYNAQSQYIKEIKEDDNPYSENDPIKKAFYFYGEQPFYGSIVYDSYREVYYRFATYPQKKMIGGQEKSIGQDVIIILDKTLRKIGETHLENVYRNVCFVSLEGLFIQKYTKNERERVFLRYDLHELANYIATKNDGTNSHYSALQSMIETEQMNQNDYVIVVPYTSCPTCVEASMKLIEANRNKNVSVLLFDVFSEKQVRRRLYKNGTQPNLKIYPLVGTQSRYPNIEKPVFVSLENRKVERVIEISQGSQEQIQKSIHFSP